MEKHTFSTNFSIPLMILFTSAKKWILRHRKDICLQWQLFGKKGRNWNDTRVQGNNTTFPAASKLAKKIIDTCNQMARKEGVTRRQTYVRVSKQLLPNTCNTKHSKCPKKARKKLQTIAGRQI